MKLLLISLALAVVGCESSLARGVHAYDAGCYPESVERLLEAEGSVRDASPHRRAHYALYRGLSHLAVGDQEQAQRWMAEAKALWDWDRSVFNDKDRGRLLSAWQALGHEPGEWGAPKLAAYR